ncbi:MAG: hypothetical protein ACJ788_06180 [Ktedonobacteraceae bacterium]
MSKADIFRNIQSWFYLKSALTGTPTAIGEQPQTTTNVKPLEKAQEGRPGMPKHKPGRIPPSATYESRQPEQTQEITNGNQYIREN